MQDISYKTSNNRCWNQLQREVTIFFGCLELAEEFGSSTFLALVFRGSGLNFCYF